MCKLVYKQSFNCIINCTEIQMKQIGPGPETESPSNETPTAHPAWGKLFTQHTVPVTMQYKLLQTKERPWSLLALSAAGEVTGEHAAGFY